MSNASDLDIGLLLINRALISVYDKTGIVDFAKGLSKWEPEILSTGGTARLIAGAGVIIREVSDFTKYPELFDGRLKTIHPRIAGGLLCMRDNEVHIEQAKKHGIVPIDLVVVNFYDFDAAIKKPGATFWTIIEQVDIGGPGMVRAAGKNFQDVAVVTSPDDYNLVLEDLEKYNGCISYALRYYLMRKMFDSTAKYEAKINEYMSSLPAEPPALAQ